MVYNIFESLTSVVIVNAESLPSTLTTGTVFFPLTKRFTVKLFPTCITSTVSSSHVTTNVLLYDSGFTPQL